jgi:microcystin degradation protein MlrC
VIGMIVDPEAAEAATAAGEGALLDRGIGAAVGFAVCRIANIPVARIGHHFQPSGAKRRDRSSFHSNR